MTGNTNKCPKVIWQKAAGTPSCHPSWQQMHSSAACTGQARSPVVGTLQQTGTCLRKSTPSQGGSGPHQIHGSLDPHESVPKWHLDQFSRFFHRSPVCPTHDPQTDRHTDHTTWDICNNRPHLCTACRRHSLKRRPQCCIILTKFNTAHRQRKNVTCKNRKQHLTYAGQLSNM